MTGAKPLARKLAETMCDNAPGALPLGRETGSASVRRQLVDEGFSIAGSSAELAIRSWKGRHSLELICSECRARTSNEVNFQPQVEEDVTRCHARGSTRPKAGSPHAAQAS